MKKIVCLFLLVSVVLTSCEKTDSPLIESWKLTESKYVITAGEDFIFFDAFGSPWQGTLRIDDKDFDPSLFGYYFNNVSGQYHFASQELLLTFHRPSQLKIDYQGVSYILDNEYTFPLLQTCLRRHTR